MNTSTKIWLIEDKLDNNPEKRPHKSHKESYGGWPSKREEALTREQTYEGGS